MYIKMQCPFGLACESSSESDSPPTVVNPYAAVTEELVAQIPALQPSVVESLVARIMDDNPPDVFRDKAKFETGKVKCMLWDWDDWDNLPDSAAMKAICDDIEKRLGGQWLDRKSVV